MRSLPNGLHDNKPSAEAFRVRPAGIVATANPAIEPGRQGMQAGSRLSRMNPARNLHGNDRRRFGREERPNTNEGWHREIRAFTKYKPVGLRSTINDKR